MTVYEVLFLQAILGSCIAQVIIYTPPGNTTACKSSNVTISCGYTSGTPFPVTWIINGTSFDEASLMNSSLYQLNNPTVLTQYSLEVFSINDTTTFQCIVHATHNDMEPINIASTRGTVTVIDVPVIEITTATGGCGYVSVSWTVPDDNDACPVRSYGIKLSSTMNELYSVRIASNQHTFDGLSFNTLFYVTVFSHYAYVAHSNSVTTSVRTMDLKEPIPINVTTNMKISIDRIMITVSWQFPSCTTEIIMMYNITVMDQCSLASVTVPANMSSVEFPDNGASIVANREYTITVSAISNQGRSYPSDPIVINTFVLRDCTVTSPSTGTITVSCDSSLQILVILTCTNDCNNPMVTSNGSSPLTVRGLDPGMMYSIIINVFDGNQVVLSDQKVTKTITVMSDETGISCSSSESTITIVIACVVTLLLSATVTAIVSSVTTYMLMKRRNENTPQDTSDKVLYEQVHSPSPSITKNDPQCQKNPAYDVGGKMAMDMAPAYESCK